MPVGGKGGSLPQSSPASGGYSGRTSAKGTLAAAVELSSSSRRYEPTNPPMSAAVTLSGCRSTISAKSSILSVDNFRSPSRSPSKTPAITAAPDEPKPRPKGISFLTWMLIPAGKDEIP
ncbi:hypothetical protein FRC15_004325 [Serendipita sp. 397]|nr:hypothetical protein FRC15_004325 [Serendipita sp. 397]